MHNISQRKKSMPILWIISILAIISILNCTETQAINKTKITESSKNLDSLNSRLKESIEHLNLENWIALHEYQNPKLREQRFPFGLEIAQPCSQETFIYNMVSITETIKSENNLPQGTKLDFRLDTISINSETNIGKAIINTYFNNNKTPILRFEQRWIYKENQWWHQEENMQETCEELGTDIN